MDITLRVAYIALAVGYLTAGGIRLIAAFSIPWIRRQYLASVPVCLLLALKACSTLWTGVASTGWSLVGLAAAGASLDVIFIRPVVKAMRVRARPTKDGDGG